MVFVSCPRRLASVVRLLLVALCVTAIIPASTPAAGMSTLPGSASSLLMNSGFEQPVIQGGIPSWKQTIGSTGIVLDGSVAYEGSYSVKIDDRSNEESIGLLSDKVDVVAGQMYRVTAKVNITDGAPSLYLNYYDAAGTQLKAFSSNFPGLPVQQWKEVTVQGIAPEGAVRAAVLLYSSRQSVLTTNFDHIDLSPVIERVEKVGTPLHSIQVNGAAFATGPNGEAWTYAVTNGNPAHFNVVETLTGQQVFSYPLANSESTSSAVTVAPDGKVYIGTNPNGRLFRWIPGDDKLDYLGKPINSETYIYRIVTDELGRVYGGTYPNGKLFRYDPADGTFRDYGVLLEGEKYARSLAYANGLLYVGLGTPAKVLRVDPVSGMVNEIVLPETEQGETFVNDLDIRGGKLYARVTGSGTLLVYDIQSGQWTDRLEHAAGIAVSTADLGGQVYFIKNDGYLYRYDPVTRTQTTTGMSKLSSARSFGWVDAGDPGFPGASIVHMDVAGVLKLYNLQTGNRRSVQADLETQAVTLRSMSAGPDGRIYFGGFVSGGLATFDPATGAIQEYPPRTIGQIDGMTTLGDELYMGVYSGAHLYRFDPSQAYQSGMNPEKLFSLLGDEQDRPFAVVAAGERIAIGTVAYYGKQGGALTLYDPATGHINVYRNPAGEQSVVSLVYEGGLLYGGTSIWGGLGTEPTETEAKLFVFDPVSGTKLWEGIPVPGEKAITSLVVSPDGGIWGLTAGKLFRFDTANRTVDTITELFDLNWGSVTQLWNGGRLEFGDDGFLYGTTLKRLFRLDPATMQHEVLADQAELFVRHEGGQLYFTRGSDLYKYLD